MKPLPIKRTATVVTDEKWQLEITGAMLITLLREAGHPIPRDATVHFTVPGGGNWSNTAVEVDQEYPISVEWKSHSVESKDLPT